MPFGYARSTRDRLDTITDVHHPRETVRFGRYRVSGGGGATTPAAGSP